MIRSYHCLQIQSNLSKQLVQYNQKDCINLSYDVIDIFYLCSRIIDGGIVYNFGIRNQQMEDILQGVSNDHRSIYYSVQLKTMDISQSIKLMGASYKENQLKTSLSDMINHYYMLETIFAEANIPHIYQIIKTIVINFNSVTAILLQKLDKAAQREISLTQIINSRQIQQNNNGKNEQFVVGNGNLLKEIKKNHLGGIHLFNQNYSRYIQDQKILDQIKVEKERRLQRKRLDILRQSILEQLNHKTDVEQFPSKNDDIANYILQVKDKNSMFNYVSYEPELQEILSFFQNSQSEANDFLLKKMKDISQEEGKFSFADFQRDIQYKNSQFKKQVVEKMSNFTQKYRTKQKEIEEYINQKQNKFNELQAKRKQRIQKQAQTDLVFDQFLQNHAKEVKELADKCFSLENIGKQHFHNNQRQNELMRDLAEKQREIDNLTRKIAEMELSIENVKQLLRDERIKRINSTKQLGEKSQRAIPQPAPFQEKQKKLYMPMKQKMNEKYSIIQQNLPSTNDNLRKTTSVSNNDWIKKQDSATFLSFHDVERGKNGNQSLKPQRKIMMKYKTIKRSNTLDIDVLQSHSNLSEMKRSQAVVEKASSSQHNQQLPPKQEGKKVEFQKNVVSQRQTKIDQLVSKHETKIALSNQEQKAKSKNNSSKQSSVSTPKHSAKALDGQNNKKSWKNIPESLTPLSSKQNIASTSLKKIRIEQNQKNSRSNTPSQILVDPKKIHTESNLKPAQIQQKINKQIVSHPQQSSNASNQPLNAQQQKKVTKSEFKKDQTAYQMYEVTQEDAQQQTLKPSLMSSKRSSMNILPYRQGELIERLNLQLKKLAIQKKLELQHVYSLAISPQINANQANKKIQTKIEHISTQESDTFSHNEKNHRRVLKLFDSLLKGQGSLNKSKAEKLKNWRKIMMNNLKSQVISQDQVDQIMSVIKGSSVSKNTSVYENAVSSIASISANLRNSLPQIQEITNIPIKPKQSLYKSKPKQKIEENEQIQNRQGSRCILLTQFEQQIQDLIKHESLQNNFTQKFHHLHKHCQEGPLCTHISKYFDTIMRHYEVLKKKERQCILLPVQHIGNRNQIQVEAQKKDKAKLQHNKSLKINKSNEFNNNLDKYSLSKHRYSQSIILPSINNSKANNYSPDKLVL